MPIYIEEGVAGVRMVEYVRGEVRDERYKRTDITGLVTNYQILECGLFSMCIPYIPVRVAINMLSDLKLKGSSIITPRYETYWTAWYVPYLGKWYKSGAKI